MHVWSRDIISVIFVKTADSLNFNIKTSRKTNIVYDSFSSSVNVIHLDAVRLSHLLDHVTAMSGHLLMHGKLIVCAVSDSK